MRIVKRYNLRIIQIVIIQTVVAGIPKEVEFLNKNKK